MTTPYFAFCREERKKIIQELGKLPVTAVAKELGKRWKSLDESEKEKFKLISKKIAESKGQGKIIGVKRPPRSLELPLQRVKKIALLAQESKKQKFSKDSLHVLTKATELFLASIGNSCTKFSNGKLVKMSSLSKVVHYGPMNLHFLKYDTPTPEQLIEKKQLERK